MNKETSTILGFFLSIFSGITLLFVVLGESLFNVPTEREFLLLGFLAGIVLMVKGYRTYLMEDDNNVYSDEDNTLTQKRIRICSTVVLFTLIVMCFILGSIIDKTIP